MKWNTEEPCVANWLLCRLHLIGHNSLGTLNDKECAVLESSFDYIFNEYLWVFISIGK